MRWHTRLSLRGNSIISYPREIVSHSTFRGKKFTKIFMTINWYGEGCFKIVENNVTITTDPVESFTGLSAPRFKTDIIVRTIMDPLLPEDEKPVAANQDETIIIAGPGEYEIKGIHISGWPLMKSSGKDMLRSIFRIKTDDLTVGLLGHLAEFNEPEILEELGDIDILIIPGGGKPFIDQQSASKLVRQISPRILIPSFFKIPNLKRKSDDATEFLKEVGLKAQSVDRLSIKKKDLGEKMQAYQLTL